MNKKIKLEDLGLSPSEMETFARGARHVLGEPEPPPQEKRKKTLKVKSLADLPVLPPDKNILK